MLNRREFLETLTVGAAIPVFGRQSAPANEWGAPVFDLHCHLRAQPPSNVAHLDGAGITKANLLTRGTVLDVLRGHRARVVHFSPDRGAWRPIS